MKSVRQELLEMKAAPPKPDHKSPGSERSLKNRSADVPLTEVQVQLLRRSFARIEPQAGIAALLFYRNLFTLQPDLRRLFHTSVELQGRKLMEALEYVVATLEAPQKLAPVLKAMGRRHVAYGVKAGHYPVVAQALIQTLGECLGAHFTPETSAAWSKALGCVSGLMIEGANEALPE